MSATDYPAARIVRRDAGAITVAVSGEIDALTTPPLRSCLNDCLAEGCSELIVDMTDLTFIDSSGLGVLVRVLNQLRPDGGRLIIHNPPPIAEKVLAISGLTPYLDIVSGDPPASKDSGESGR